MNNQDEVEENKVFSSNFYKANKSLKKLEEMYKNVQSNTEREKIEVLALLESNMDILKIKYSNVSNLYKQDCIIKFVCEQGNFNLKPILEDKNISYYLLKNGIVSKEFFYIIDAALKQVTLLFLLSLVYLISDVNEFNIFEYMFLWIISTVLAFFMPIFHKINLYRIKK